MTVSSEINRSDFSGNGSTTAFATNFRFLENPDIKVILTVISTGVETEQVEGPDYTLTGAGLDAGGTVTMIIAPATGETLTIKRDLLITQQTNYVENDAFPALSHEDALDKVTMIVQQQQEEIGRAFKFSEASQNAGATVDDPEAARLLSWDATGNLINVDVEDFGAVAITDFGKELVISSDSKAARDLLEITNSPLTHLKTIKVFPFRNPDYDASIIRFGTLFPQAFVIDLIADEILFLGNQTPDKSVVVFRFSDLTYIKTYGITGTFTSEAAVILYEGATRFLYVRNGNELSKYDITTTVNGGTVAPSSTISIPIDRVFSHNNGQWLFANRDFLLGNFLSRGTYTIYDSDFVKLRDIFLDPMHTGLIEGVPDTGLISKIQAMAWTGESMFLGMGGLWEATEITPTAVGSYGIRQFGLDGTLKRSVMLDPALLLARMQELGFQPDRIENEGIQALDGKLYSLMVGASSSTSVPIAEVEGLFIFEEFSADPDAIDFSSAASSISDMPNRSSFESGVFPRSESGIIINPINQVTFTTWDQIFDYMIGVHQTYFLYYSSSVTNITDIDGNIIPVGTAVKFVNVNNDTFFASLTTATNQSEEFQITGVSGSRVKVLLRTSAKQLKIKDNESGGVDLFNRLIAQNQTISTAEVLVIDQQSSATRNLLLLGGGSGLFTSATEIRIALNAVSTSLGGTTQWQYVPGALNPFLDNAFDIGNGSQRIKDLFIVNAVTVGSDARMKEDIADIHETVLDAWGSIGYKGFVYKDREDNRTHHGVIAQDIIAAFSAKGLDALNYGLVRLITWNSTPEERNDTDTVIRAMVPAGERFEVCYNEVFAIESAFQRREDEIIKQDISDLIQRLDDAGIL